MSLFQRTVNRMRMGFDMILLFTQYIFIMGFLASSILSLPLILFSLTSLLTLGYLHLRATTLVLAPVTYMMRLLLKKLDAFAASEEPPETAEVSESETDMDMDQRTICA